MYDVNYIEIAKADKKPDVSFVVPVFNGEKFIRRCVEYIVYQTKKEVEVVIVDNVSDDMTLEICKEMAEIFPDKVSIYELENHYDYGAVGRNLGVILAQGDYIMFCDADDIVHFKAAELSFDKAIEEACDLVYFKFYKVENDSVRVCGNVSNVSGKEMIIKGDSSFWTKCFKKDLLLNYGRIPDDIISEDFAYVFGSIERAEKIGYVNVPLYYYIKRGDSELHSLFSNKKLDMIKAHMYALDSCDENREYMEYVVARHIRVNITRDWVQQDKFILHLKELWPKLKINTYVKEDSILYSFLENYVENTVEPLMPCVYVNGFNKKYTNDDLEYIKERVFVEESKITVLDEDNCNIECNQIVENAYKEKKYDFVGEYFALRNIYENGGVYIGPNVVIDAPLNMLRCLKGFIGYLDYKIFSSSVFGAHEKNPFFKTILDTYETVFYEDSFLPLSKRFRNVLIGRYGYKIDGEMNLFDNEDIAILSAEVLSFNVPPKSEFDMKPHLTHIKYFDGDENYVVVNKNIWNFVSPVYKYEYDKTIKNYQVTRHDRDIKRKERDVARRDLQKLRNERNLVLGKHNQLESLKTENDRIIKECNRLSDENDKLFSLVIDSRITKSNNDCIEEIEALKRKIEQMENSKSWRWTRWIRSIMWRFKQ